MPNPETVKVMVFPDGRERVTLLPMSTPRIFFAFSVRITDLFGREASLFQIVHDIGDKRSSTPQMATRESFNR